MKELKLDTNRLILTADKGVALVVLDKEDYIKKAEDLLEDNTYKKIDKDPTSQAEKQINQHIKKYQGRGRLEGRSVQKIISNRCWVSKILWAAKNP